MHTALGPPLLRLGQIDPHFLQQSQLVGVALSGGLEGREGLLATGECDLD